MKRCLMASALACVFSISVVAGEIPTDGSPQPHSQSTTTVTTSPGEIPSDGGARSISDAAISAILSALGLAAI